jgi:hypothetical protein
MIDRLMESWSTPDAASLLRLNFDSVSVGWYLELDVSTPVYFAGSYSDLDSRRCLGGLIDFFLHRFPTTGSESSKKKKTAGSRGHSVEELR